MPASSGGATNCQLTVTFFVQLQTRRSARFGQPLNYRSADSLRPSCHLWLPATCHSIGKFPFRHAATIRRPSQSCKNYNSRKIFIFCSIGNWLLSASSSCFLFLLLLLLLFGNSTKHKHIITTVAQCPVNTCCRFLISSGSAFPVLFLFFLSLCTFLMTIFCYSFRLVQFQFSTTDCYLNDSIPFCSFVCVDPSRVRGTRGYFIVF